MRLVRLGKEPTKVTADLRAALSAWGTGDGVLGGVALLGCSPPGSSRPLDAVIVTPRGVIVVVGVDLPEPARRLAAPLHTPWSADGRPLALEAHPAAEALRAADSVDRVFRAIGAEAPPVAAVVAVGPFVEQVVQAEWDRDPRLRVLHPSTTSMLTAVRELASGEQRLPVEATRRLLRALDSRGGRTSVAELTSEGFPDVVSPEVAAADTALLERITDEPQSEPSPGGSGTRNVPRPGKALIAGAVALVVACSVIGAFLRAGPPDAATPQPVQDPGVLHLGGIDFAPRTTLHNTECAPHANGEVRTWFGTHPCTSLHRSVFQATSGGREATVSVAVIDLADQASALELRDLLDRTTSGGINDPLVEGYRWAGAPESFADAAQKLEQSGNQVRLVRGTWSRGGSTPDDPDLRRVCEQGMRLAALR